ncbi:exocyst complex component EXO84C-like [Benincasa hispida]|uniref:exocyst complex component EXO84C-like n=1 Tax=Benincasa hispida TaxID=102211 RepID=UPI0018FF2294|nr:exocyst complex component EXO84C-like [Benincasa hispida]
MQSASSSFSARFHENGDVEDFRRTDHASGDSDDESEVRSMTAKGINHLCSELLELKAESNGDFHRIIISSCLSFSRAFEKVKVMEQDLMHLKGTISTHTALVKDLMDSMDLDIESDETVDSTLQASECNRISSLIELEAHIYEVSNALDTLIYENKVAEALETIKSEDENLQRLKVEEDEEDYPFDIVMLYDCVISDKKAKIKLRLENVCENTKTPVQEETGPAAGQPPLINSQVLEERLLD